ncbi:MAG: L-threonine 3-dehydrogenase [Chitinophagales bacterium]
MKGTMKAVAKLKAAPGAELIEAPIPEVPSQHVLVKVLATAICGTDIHIYNWDPWAQGRLKVPRIFGHEFCGEIVELGEGVKGFSLGEYVSVETHVACGQCYFCKNGQAHICQEVEIIGVDRDGCFAEYVSVPVANVWRMDRSIPVEIAAIQDPLGNAIHTALAQELIGNYVEVIGCGPIGLCAVAIARHAGAAKIVAADVNDFRLDLARRLGATLTVNTTQTRLDEAVLEHTRGFGADVMLEMSGHPDAIRQGFAALRKGGQVALLGIPSRPMELDLADAIVFKGATVRGINGRKMFGTWYKAMALLEAGLDVSPVITAKFKLDEFHHAMELARSHEAGKIILYP